MDFNRINNFLEELNNLSILDDGSTPGVAIPSSDFLIKNEGWFNRVVNLFAAEKSEPSKSINNNVIDLKYVIHRLLEDAESLGHAQGIDSTKLDSVIVRMSHLMRNVKTQRFQTASILCDLMSLKDLVSQARRPQSSSKPKDSQIDEHLASYFQDKICFYIETNDELKSEMKGLVIDKGLTKLTEIKDPTGKSEKTLRVPDEFHIDSSRIARLSFNDEPLFISGAKFNMSEYERYDFLIERLGEEVFERLGTFLQQGFFAKMTVKIFDLIPFDKSSDENSPWYNFSVSNVSGSGCSFDIYYEAEKEKVEVKAAVMMKIVTGMDAAPCGYFIINRYFSLPVEDLKGKLEEKNREDLLPGLIIYESNTGICSSAKAAEEAFENRKIDIPQL